MQKQSFHSFLSVWESAHTEMSNINAWSFSGDAVLYTLRAQFPHVCVSRCFHCSWKCAASLCVYFAPAFRVSVQSVRPHLAKDYFYPCNCVTELILKALFLAQNIPSCLCTVPTRPIHSSLPKTLAVICFFLRTPKPIGLPLLCAWGVIFWCGCLRVASFCC